MAVKGELSYALVGFFSGVLGGGVVQGSADCFELFLRGIGDLCGVRVVMRVRV